MNIIEVKADSMTHRGHRITTFVGEFPRMVLAEFNTHREFSRNSASSRAVPYETMRAQVMERPFIPFGFQKSHKGMQGTEYFEGAEKQEMIDNWLKARDEAVKVADVMYASGCTKQLINRLLEPFMMHRVIVTATNYGNFIALRAHEDAEIHIQNFAYKLLRIYNESQPKLLKDGEWHIPFGDDMDESKLFSVMMEYCPSDLTPEEQDNWLVDNMEDFKIKIATARCARVSYLNFEGKDDYSADVKLYERLSGVGHWSPFEHCAMAMSRPDSLKEATTMLGDKVKVVDYRSGNFEGFVQLRKMFKGERKSDPRVKKWA